MWRGTVNLQDKANQSGNGYEYSQNKRMLTIFVPAESRMFESKSKLRKKV